ncbi:DUF485 domain-containing protein [Azospirillum halopraeferens]|uniref:DUF485 domain-containing protein n=1 Tax=Azospirillum halopraeferens TaxID=34010 RepID=UPI0004089DE1|nr:DUF485 domain-containing protein [Azospirillum halopraeferens]
MSDPVYRRVRENPKFRELVRRRGRLALTLSLIVLVSYYALMMAVAFAPDALRTPIAQGSAISIGFPLSAVVIIVSWLLTGVYSYFANGAFEDLNNEIVAESGQ